MRLSNVTLPRALVSALVVMAVSWGSHASPPSLSAPDEVPIHRIGELERSIGFYQAIEIEEDSLLYSTTSKYQQIEVHQTKHYGKMLVLDGVIQLTERDADSYNEMMAHVPMFQHPNPKRVLVIGGGDGYVLNEVLKHGSVEHVDHVDLDDGVIKTCERFFPQWGIAWKDPRATLHIKDGAQFVRDTKDSYYDVIIQDSSDPWLVEEDGSTTALPSSVLYDEGHFRELHRILSPGGVLNIQAESFNVPSSLEGIVVWRKFMEKVGFARSRYGSIYTSSYPTGQIGFLLAEKDLKSTPTRKAIAKRYDAMVKSGRPTTYYHSPIQRGSFDLPLWVHSQIYGGEETPDLECTDNIDTTEGSTSDM